MFKYEMHCHTNAVSKCGRSTPEDMVKAYYGTTLIEADATNQTTAPSDPSRLTDLTISQYHIKSGQSSYSLKCRRSYY